MVEPRAMDTVVIAVDQGTSATKAVALDTSGMVIASAAVGLDQSHPGPGHVEQDPEAILESVRHLLTTMAASFGDRIAAIGLANQRESAVIWDRTTGRALAPVLGWQDRRTADRAARLAAADADPLVRSISGLPLDPMFSALKFSEQLDRVDPTRKRSAAGEIALGTIDSWLLFRLTGEHRIEAGNASRTQLLDVALVEWSQTLLDLFDIPVAALPRIAASDEPSRAITGVPGLTSGLRFDAVLADSHSALFAHGVREVGTVKASYGSGSSLMGLTSPVFDATASPALAHSIAWALGTPGAGAQRAFEGNILSAGATLVWLGRLLGCEPDELDRLARHADESATVDIVPAFAGLGAPWWDGSAQAVISGFDFGASTPELSRAAFESIALQIEDVAAAAAAATGQPIDLLLADGGPSRNDWLMQVQADLGGRVVARAAATALSAIGAAQLAGISSGVYTDEGLEPSRTARTVFTPATTPEARRARAERWSHAVARSRLAPATTHTEGASS